MSLSRRDFIKVGGIATAALAATSCGTAGREAVNAEIPTVLTIPDASGGLALTGGDLPDPELRMLNRVGYGPRPGGLARVREMGIEAYLAEQLDPDSIEDRASELLSRNLHLYSMEIDLLLDQDETDVAVDLVANTILRALYSRRQLYEAMVEFWSDHFNIYLRKNEFMPALKLVDDRDVIRPHALGKFRDLVFASAQSPAMLTYLDNIQSVKEAPNENYARELMELHTLGVDGGYCQCDVEELARALTGWNVGRRGRNRGQFVFNASEHDPGEKIFLGEILPGGETQDDIFKALEILVNHPSTAGFIATKLIRRFVADDPPDALVDSVAAEFTATDGDIKSMLRVIFLSDEFATAPLKLKRPFTYMISTMRALNVDVRSRGFRNLWNWLGMMGQQLYHWPPPDGYPDTSEEWAANLLPRWNFATAILRGEISGVQTPFEDLVKRGGVNQAEGILQLFAGLTLGNSLNEESLSLFLHYTGEGSLDEPEIRKRLIESVGLLLASPAFHWT